ncbi:TPA: hypothetical protein N0F65_009271 [Lagenidium giganteum]|uniref:inositol-phosphate phosphatase n=1 Tax=Lagenidium giganteum TaxID=4803 RepID=A0AAV2YPF4_9STRA|nr:TPA: hypothetical protein N0F65_009271 [Lagenidium giganteum]
MPLRRTTEAISAMSATGTTTPDCALEEMLQTAIEAARAAGAHMRANLRSARVEKTKSNKDDLVTVVDKQCQDIVFRTIKETYPTHEFLGEESVEPGSEASKQAMLAMVSKEWLWIVDPIDGTTNFVHKRPSSVVSVACANRGEVVVGVIYDPYRDEIFATRKGKGTHLNGRRVYVSEESTFSEALIGFGIGTKDSVRLPMLDCVREFSASCRGLRLQGAAALELAWTSCGRQTGFYELDLNSWDVAAGALLVQEAGGRVSDSAGNAFTLNTRNIVVSNGVGDIHQTILDKIALANAVTVRASSTQQLPTAALVRALAEASALPAAADASAKKVNPWFFMCGPLAANAFLLGAACNLYLFQRHDLAIDKVFDMRQHEIPTAKGVAGFAGVLFLVQMAVFGAAAHRRGDQFGQDEVRMELLLVLYCVLAALLLFCPFDVLHRPCRMFIIRKLGRCLWPFQYAFSLQLPPSATPFVEVFLADGLTSLSKFIQDAAVAFMLLCLSFTQELEELRGSYVTKMKHSPLPYFAASVPYIIRATQCLISFKRTTNSNDRFLHLLNTLKYCSSLLVISVGAYPQVMGVGSGHSKDQSTFFLFCAVFNSMYSFMWDVIMDWGLGQPSLPKRVRFLRHQLLYSPATIYYVVIAIDFSLRILWVTKWWDWRQYGVDFKMLSQLAEVCRRCMWNCVRVEWQCIKLEILGSKKLSEDSMELEQSMENMPLMDDDDSESGSSGGDDDDQGTVRQSDELMAPASITVATFSGDTTHVTVLTGASVNRHHRRPQSFDADGDAPGDISSALAGSTGAASGMAINS